MAHERLLRKCFIDYDREMALVVECTDATSGREEILGVGRLARQRDSQEGEVAVLVTDGAQHLGLGAELLRPLIEIARAEEYESIVAQILPESHAMRRLADRFGFQILPQEDPSEVVAVLKL